MSTQTHSGYLVLADISGFTSYVAQTELAHSQEILGELLELIVRHTRPVLTLSKFEGDAVFAYSTQAALLSGERLLEAIESTYVAFRGRVEGIRQRTTCTCAACSMIPMLDLKFMVHYGEFMFQSISGARELVGSDVNLVHRLAKNHIFEDQGWNAYALYTDIALDQMELPSEGMHPSVETYEHLGDIQTYSSDLRTRYEEIIATRRFFVEENESHAKIEVELSVPPIVAWEWMTEPDMRNQWSPEVVWSAALRPGGRTGIGAQNHCAHGDGQITLETIVDWHPFEYYSVETQTDITREGWLDNYATIAFEPLDDGTRTRLIHRTQMVKPTLATRIMAKWFEIAMKKVYRTLAETIAASG